jgi:pilus assembly protein CpaC
MNGQSIGGTDEGGTSANVDNTVETGAKGLSNVIDMLQMTNPSQINIETLIVDISTSDAKDLGIEYGNLNGDSPNTYSRTSNSSTSGSWNGSYNYTTTDGVFWDRAASVDGSVGGDWGSTRSRTTGVDSSSDIGSSGVFSFGQDHFNSHTGHWFISHFRNINAKLQLLITTGKARVLSRPNITTMSGQAANILIGGSIPFQTTSSDGTQTDWRNYGVELKIKPTVDKDDNITTGFFAGVSSVDWGNAVNGQPAFKERNATAVVNIPSGMTMVIGGLINSEDSKTIKKIPLLGDIPIIGEFFKSTSHSRDKRELIILLTPRLVNETTPALMSPRMKEAYDDGRKDREKMLKIDVNSSDIKDEVVEDPAEEKNSEGDSILGKYLNRDVLPKPEETDKK